MISPTIKKVQYRNDSGISGHISVCQLLPSAGSTSQASSFAGSQGCSWRPGTRRYGRRLELPPNFAAFLECHCSTVMMHFQLETKIADLTQCTYVMCVYVWYTHTHVHTRVYIFECMLEFRCQPQHKTGWEHPLIPEAMAAACEGFFSLKLLIAPWSIWSWPVDAIG